MVNCLEAIFNQGKQADKVIAKMLKSDKRWGKRDRGFIAENTYEIIRWKRLYAELADVKEPFSNSESLATAKREVVLQGISLPPWDEVRKHLLEGLRENLMVFKKSSFGMFDYRLVG